MDASAVDILDQIPALPLTAYSYVRIPCGADDWIDIEVRDGKPTIRGNRGFLIRPLVANSIIIEYADRRI